MRRRETAMRRFSWAACVLSGSLLGDLPHLIMASEEDTILFGSKLREVGHRLRWIGFEVEAVPGFRRRGDGDRNRGRTLEEVAAELVRRVAESSEALGNAAPLDFQRVDDGVEDPER